MFSWQESDLCLDILWQFSHPITLADIAPKWSRSVAFQNK
jgi:hypothetical protein